MYIYIYIYTCHDNTHKHNTIMRSHSSAPRSSGSARRSAAKLREYLSTGYGLQFSTEIYSGANGRKQFSTKTYKKPVLLQKSPKIFGNLRESTGCNLGILYSSSL